MVIFLGLDPGLDGAVAMIDGHDVQLHDSPSWAVQSGKHSRREYDVAGMTQIILAVMARVENRGSIVAGLEAVHSMPKQGVASSFKFGVGLGIWQGILAALGIKFEMVTPQRWQKALLDGMGKGKDGSMIVAQRLFPTADLRLRKHHGRADALLLAEFMRRTTAAKEL